MKLVKSFDVKLVTSFMIYANDKEKNYMIVRDRSYIARDMLNYAYSEKPTRLVFLKTTYIGLSL